MLSQPDITNSDSVETILVVDDEAEIRDSVCLWLSHFGFAVETASDGLEGVAAAIRCRPQAIILDMLMPRMDGLAALREITNDARTRSIPVIMLSASLREEQRTLDAGATFFVHKPYDGKNLVSFVKAAIARKNDFSTELKQVV